MPNLPSIPDIAKQVDLNKTDILLRTLAGGYTGTSADLKSLIDGVTNEINKASNGWFKDKITGLILQWGEAGAYEGVVTNSKRVEVALPISFSNYDYKVFASEQLGSDYMAYQSKVNTSALNSSRFYLSYIRPDGITAILYVNQVKWFAIGY